MLPLNVTHQAWFLAPTQSWKGAEKLSFLKTVQIQVWNSISVLSLEYWGVSEEYLLVGIKIDCCGGDVPMVCVWYQLLAARHRESNHQQVCVLEAEKTKQTVISQTIITNTTESFVSFPGYMKDCSCQGMKLFKQWALIVIDFLLFKSYFIIVSCPIVVFNTVAQK